MRTFLFEFREALRNAFDAIWQNKLRAILTTLGIIIGIVMVTTTMTTINGMERAFEKSMAMLGNNTYYVQQQSWFNPPSEAWKTRTASAGSPPAINARISSSACFWRAGSARTTWRSRSRADRWSPASSSSSARSPTWTR